MARRKVKLAWIANDYVRRTTFKKRKKGLIKKMNELTTLCNIKACMIIHSPEEPPQQQPEAWPSAPEATRVAAQLRSMPEMDQHKKMMNQEEFLRQRLTRLREQLRRLQNNNHDLEVTLLMHQVLSNQSLCGIIGLEDARSLEKMADMKLNLVQNRIKRETMQIAALQSAAEASASAPATGKEIMIPLEMTMASAQSTGKEIMFPLPMAMESLQTQNWPWFGITDSNQSIVLGGGEEEPKPISYAFPDSTWLNPSYFPSF